MVDPKEAVGGVTDNGAKPLRLLPERRLHRFFVFAAIAVLSMAGAYPFGSKSYQDWIYFDRLRLIFRAAFRDYDFVAFHDPWKCGGLDLLANPQTRAFSPFLLLDITAHPHWANLLTLIILAGFGAWGMYRYLRHLGIGGNASFVASVTYIASTWFALHYLEGHIAYATFQIFPWIFLAWDRFDERPYRLLIMVLLAFCLVEGGFYTFIFSFYWFATTLVVSIMPLRRIVTALKDIGFTLGTMLVFILLSLPKTFPIITELADRTPELEYFGVPLQTTLLALFVPIQRSTYPSGLEHVSYHEISCYLGLFQVGLLLWTMRKKAFLKGNWKWFVLLVFWFWTGSGWIEDANPWSVFIHRLPLFNNAHVQSRTWFLMFVVFTVLFARAFDQASFGRWQLWIAVFLFAESFVVRNVPFEYYRQRPAQAWASEFGEHNVTLEETDVDYNFFPNRGSVNCYEPAKMFDTKALAHNHADYMGEIYPLKPGVTADIVSYKAGHLIFWVKPVHRGTKKAYIEVNTNDLGHWQVHSNNGVVVSERGMLLQLMIDLDPNEPETFVDVRYRPNYLWPVTGLYGLGILMAAAMFWWTRRARGGAES